jgi:hypothetical protein
MSRFFFLFFCFFFFISIFIKLKNIFLFFNSDVRVHLTLQSIFIKKTKFDIWFKLRTDTSILWDNYEIKM